MSNTVVDDVVNELHRSVIVHGEFHSLHEGLAVLREEYLEFEQEIFWGIQRKQGNTATVRSEAIQVAAMAMKIAEMVSPKQEGENE